MATLSYPELLKYLTELFTYDAFELHTESTSDDMHNFYIPYMMNDALECYLFLENGQLTGTYLPNFKGEWSVELTDTNTKSGLIFHQGRDNVFTLWFENCYRILNLYRYDQIGHFWVKGQEHWRQLVYIVGTIHDKYNYMGTAVCNEEEFDLLPLMEFAPFRYYSPLHESLDEYYTETPNGTTCMIKLANEVNDHHFLFWLNLYKKFPSPIVSRLLARMMNHPSRQMLYELIYTKMQNASMRYSERKYSDEANSQIETLRLKVTKELYSHGFQGDYPRFSKGSIQILATEEHPFTILESDTFDFKIQLMVSETKEKNPGLNAGFFQKGTSYIYSIDTNSALVP